MNGDLQASASCPLHGGDLIRTYGIKKASRHIFSAQFRRAIFSLLLTAVSVTCGCDKSEDREHPDSIADEVVGVGIPTDVMVLHATEQRGSNWCWAASAQMALATQSVDISQEEIVRGLFGSLMDSPGGFPHFFALTGPYRSRVGVIHVTCEFGQGPPALEFLIETLRQNRPVILACANPDSDIGHAVVATAVICRDSVEGRQLLEVVVRDPSPGIGKRLLSATEYESVTYHAVYKTTPGLRN